MTIRQGHTLEQLWYTWASVGLGGNTGYQVRAASARLRGENNRRVLALRQYLNYALPQGTDPSRATPQTAPVALAFLNPGKDTTPDGYANPHVLLHKVLKGEDANKRPGVFFVHVLDQLPAEFVASDAIDLWASRFWRTSDNDEPVPPPDHSLEQVPLALLPQGAMVNYPDAIAAYRDVIERCLPYVIQAFLALKPGQKLYIVAPAEHVAALIWGLTHSLPRSFQLAQNMTFSTYEKDVTQAPGRIIGTCRADASMLYTYSGGAAQRPLPSNAFSGSGPALALDCATSEQAAFQPNETDAGYAAYVTSLLTSGRMNELERKLAIATQNGIVDLAGLRSFIKTHINARELTPQEVLALLSNPRQAAWDLESDNALRSLLKHWVFLPQWRTGQALPALETLRLILLVAYEQKAPDKAEKARLKHAGYHSTLTREDIIRLKEAFQELAKCTAEELAVSLVDDAPCLALQDLFALSVFEDTILAARTHLITNLQGLLQRPDFDRAQRSLAWEKREWLLQQALAVAAARITPVNDRLLALWLPHSWEELHIFLDTEDLFPENWRRDAIADLIYTTRRAGAPFPRRSARRILEKYPGPLFAAIADLLQARETQGDALHFCTQLLQTIVRRRSGVVGAVLNGWQRVVNVVVFVPRALRNAGRQVWSFLTLQQGRQNAALVMDWKAVVIPVLRIEIKPPAPPIILDGLLKAARLHRSECYTLVAQHSRSLLTASHAASPFLEDTCAIFLDGLARKAEDVAGRASFQRFAPPRTFEALERLQLLNWTDERRRAQAGHLLGLAVTARPERFEYYLKTRGEDFLPKLVGAIRAFSLTGEHAYMNNLYHLILTTLHSVRQLDLVVDHLALLSNGDSRRTHSADGHLEDQRRFLAELAEYGTRGNYVFRIDALLPYIELACRYAPLKNPKKFLKPLLSDLAQARYPSYAFSNFDQRVQTTLAATPAYLELWRKYGPGAVDKETPPLRTEDEYATQAAYPGSWPQDRLGADAASTQRQGESTAPTPDAGPGNAHDADTSDGQRTAARGSGVDYPAGFLANPLTVSQAPAQLAASSGRVLSRVRDQSITAERVKELAAAYEHYIPWRIGFLARAFKNLTNQHKDAASRNEQERIKHQLYGLQDELDTLRELPIGGEHVLRVLENDLVMYYFLSDNGDQHLYRAPHDEEYQKIKKDRTYQEMARQGGEKHIADLFTMCMQYSDLGLYLRKTQSGRSIREWLDIRRKHEGLRL